MNNSGMRGSHVARHRALWILGQESEADSPLDAAERACEKLSLSLAQVVTRAGVERLLARASYLASADFPLLAGLKVGGAGGGSCFGELRQRLDGVHPKEATEAIVDVLGHAIGLMDSFIGTDLVSRRLRVTWPGLPSEESIPSGEELKP